MQFAMQIKYLARATLQPDLKMKNAFRMRN